MKGEFCHANMARQDRARDRTSSDTINRNTVESLIMFFFFLFKCHLIEVRQQLLEPSLWEVSLRLVLPIRLWYGLRDGCRHFIHVHRMLGFLPRLHITCSGFTLPLFRTIRLV